MLVTPFFAAILTLLYIALSFVVIRQRVAKKVILGDGAGDREHRELQVAVRVHSNFAEYVPLALLLMWFVETVLFDSRFALIMGVVLLLGRILHIVGMHNPKKFLVLRQLGIVATFGVLVVGASKLLWQYVPI